MLAAYIVAIVMALAIGSLSAKVFVENVEAVLVEFSHV